MLGQLFWVKVCVLRQDPHRRARVLCLLYDVCGDLCFDSYFVTHTPTTYLSTIRTANSMSILTFRLFVCGRLACAWSLRRLYCRHNNTIRRRRRRQCDVMMCRVTSWFRVYWSILLRVVRFVCLFVCIYVVLPLVCLVRIALTLKDKYKLHARNYYDGRTYRTHLHIYIHHPAAAA